MYDGFVAKLQRLKQRQAPEPNPLVVGRDGYRRFLDVMSVDPETELYLGLVHAQDGVDGTRRRIEKAKKYTPHFGIASECGISRGRDPNTALEFIKTYAAAAAAV